MFGTPFRLDYLEHFGIFFILGMLYIVARYKYNINVVILLTIYAVLVEFVQIIIPGRTFNPWDFIYNLIGLILSIGLMKKIFTSKRKNWKILKTQQ
jgi:VanZ family protein